MDVGLDLFLEHIILSTSYPIKNQIVSTILKQIQLERDNYAINQSAIKLCVHILQALYVEKHSVTVYSKHFEPDFLKESEMFYKLEGETLLDTCDAPTYLERVRALILFSSKIRSQNRHRLRSVSVQKSSEHIIILTHEHIYLYAVFSNHPFSLLILMP